MKKACMSLWSCLKKLHYSKQVHTTQYSKRRIGKVDSYATV